MHNVGPLDEFAKDLQQIEKNGVEKELVAITNPQTIDLHVLVVRNFESAAQTVDIRCRDSYAAAKRGQPSAQPVPGAYGATVRPRRIKRGLT